MSFYGQLVTLNHGGMQRLNRFHWALVARPFLSIHNVFVAIFLSVSFPSCNLVMVLSVINCQIF